MIFRELSIFSVMSILQFCYGQDTHDHCMGSNCSPETFIVSHQIDQLRILALTHNQTIKEITRLNTDLEDKIQDLEAIMDRNAIEIARLQVSSTHVVKR